MIDQNGFDREFYLARYPDVAKSGVDPYQHFIQYGWKEGRNPNLVFDTKFYLRTNLDVARSGMNPLEHFMKYGWREARDPSAAFDTLDYLNVYADVAKAGINPMLHYLQYGITEGRPLATSVAAEIKEGFDRVAYLKAYPDVAKAGVDPYLHYVQFGEAEGRFANPLFNKAYYLAQNPDVARAGVDPLEHFMTYGWREGRDPSAAFSLKKYVPPFDYPPGTNPLIYVLTTQRYGNYASDILAAPGNPIRPNGFLAFNPFLIGDVTFTIDGSTTHVSAPNNLLDGRELIGFKWFDLSSSLANITIQVNGQLPQQVFFGSGNNRLSGTYDFPVVPPESGASSAPPSISAGSGSLTVDATFKNAALVIYGHAAGSTIAITSRVSTDFYGGAGNDVLNLGPGYDTISAGGGTNLLNGGGGGNLVIWGSAVRADLQTGLATPLDGSTTFRDTLVSIADLGGSSSSDILLGDDQANWIRGLYGAASASGSPGGDFLAGRGGNDTITGSPGNDTIIGGTGIDILFGGDGDDLLIDGIATGDPNGVSTSIQGGNGNDRLVFQLGSQTGAGALTYLIGGAGADTFIIDPSRGTSGKLICDFNLFDGDRVDLSALRSATGAVLTLSDVLAAANLSSNAAAVIDLAAFRDASGKALSGSLTLSYNVLPTALKAADFIFTPSSDWHSAIPSEFLGLI